MLRWSCHFPGCETEDSSRKYQEEAPQTFLIPGISPAPQKFCISLCSFVPFICFSTAELDYLAFFSLLTKPSQSCFSVSHVSNVLVIPDNMRY